jgi:hypothetical protein
MRHKKISQVFAGVMVAALVVTGTVLPTTTAQAASKTVTVKTQAQLNAALKNKKVTSIIIKTSKSASFKIKAGDYGNKKLTINSPKATINNLGQWKQIAIKDSKTVYDKALNNKIVVSDPNGLKLVASKSSAYTSVTITAAAGKVNIVNNGQIDGLTVNNSSKITLSGNAESGPVINVKSDANITVAEDANVGAVIVKKEDAKVSITANGTIDKVVVSKAADVTLGGTTEKVTVQNNAEGTTINSSVPTTVKLNADASVNLEAGAEGSTVKVTDSSVTPTVSNNTTEPVKMTDAAGKESTIEEGKTSEAATPSTDTDKNASDNKDAAETKQPETQTAGTGTGGGGVQTPVVDNQEGQEGQETPATPVSVKVALGVVTGGGVTVSPSAASVSFEVSTSTALTAKPSNANENSEYVGFEITEIEGKEQTVQKVSGTGVTPDDKVANRFWLELNDSTTITVEYGESSTGTFTIALQKSVKS